jgi:hypothetical protein
VYFQDGPESRLNGPPYSIYCLYPVAGKSLMKVYMSQYMLTSIFLQVQFGRSTRNELTILPSH